MNALVSAGALLFGTGFLTLGVQNTSGLPGGFVARGPYRLTRNPQYLGDVLMFAGVSIAANSGIGLVTHALTALIFLVAPMAEEPWLEEPYGRTYARYRRRVPRFV